MPLAPLMGEIKTRDHRVFCRKFNFIQFLFEVFSTTIGTVGNIQPESELTFPLVCNHMKQHCMVPKKRPA